ncbi:aspartate-tRNA ligase [Periconia macrospinosa]|uniref:aspartate--tRNA ligase n=1 Tax=Periconia macrospinosa TaxID=97972 RepID=A0A2V1DL89_9PLEO|nr:aspartate-tRNA ligase [Periconia macrospinosa]
MPRMKYVRRNRVSLHMHPITAAPEIPNASLTSGTATCDARVNSKFSQKDPKEGLLDLRILNESLRARVQAGVVGPKAWQQTTELTVESIVRITVSPKFRMNNDTGKGTPERESYDLDIQNIEVIALASESLPSISPNSQLEDRLNNRILDVRHNASGAVFKLHSGMCQLIVEFLCSKGFHWIHTPRIINATVAGDNEFFDLPYFNGDAWLAQSTQHHKQMALSMDMERVFEIGPVFRSEAKSRASSRHLTEFTVLDIAMTFQEDYREVVDTIESMLIFVLTNLQKREKFRQLLDAVRRDHPSAREFSIGLDERGKIPRVTFAEAKRILQQDLGIEANPNKNFTDEEEAALGRHFLATLHTDIFTIEQYPASMRQFNSKASADTPELSNTWDTIVRGREICSGSQRINSYPELCEAMRAGVCGPAMDPEDEKWQPYLSAFKSGMPQHGGCGLGVNRLLQGFLGLKDVREVTLFPRDVNRLAP